MIRLFILVILLAGLIVGAWLSYDRLSGASPVVQKVEIPPPPGVEQSRPDLLDQPLGRALTMIRDGAMEDALALLQPLVAQAHTSRRFDELKSVVGELNLFLFLSPSPGPGKINYTVVSGDSISKISAKFKAPADLLMRVNNLTTIDLRVGQQLVVPVGEFSAVILPARKSLILFRGLDFFKEYTLSSAKPPAGIKPGEKLKVTDKIAWRKSARVAFGNPEYHGSARWISLSAAGATIYSHQAADTSDVAPPATGFALEPADMNELFLFLPRDAVVQINE